MDFVEESIQEISTYNRFPPFQSGPSCAPVIDIAHSSAPVAYSRRTALQEFKLLETPYGDDILSVVRTFRVEHPSEQTAALIVKVSQLLSLHYSIAQAIRKSQAATT